jgi:WXG100 family type VII secretion target
VTIELLHQAFTQGKTDVREGAARLCHDRDAIDRQVGGFLRDGWTGVAADSFVIAWDDWKTAAGDVLEGLVAMGELLEAAHADFVEQDAGSQAQLDAISERIIARLG